MIALDLSSSLLPTVRSTESGKKALSIMQTFLVKHLPIVNQEKLIGVISEEEILVQNPDKPIDSYGLSYQRDHVKDHEHIFKVIALIAERKLSLIPVIDNEENYVGAITSHELLHYLAVSFSFTEPGNVIVIETDKSNYVLSEIAKIIEEENAVILSSFVTSKPHSNKIFITLKLSKTDLQYIKASLERYDYVVTAFYSEGQGNEHLQEHYDSLMKYLSI